MCTSTECSRVAELHWLHPFWRGQLTSITLLLQMLLERFSRTGLKGVWFLSGSTLLENCQLTSDHVAFTDTSTLKEINNRTSSDPEITLLTSKIWFFFSLYKQWEFAHFTAMCTKLESIILRNIN